MRAVPSEGDWAWVARDNGAVVLVQVATGHTVMDCVRKSTQACAPRFASWPGQAEGKPRAGHVGKLSLAHSWFDSKGRLVHPDAWLIQASPNLLFALRTAQAKLVAAARSADPRPLIAEAQRVQALAISLAEGGAQ